MRGMTLLRRAVLLGVTIGFAAFGWAGEKPEAPKPEKEGVPADVVAKVDDELISRADLELARRQLAMNPRAPKPNNSQLLDQLIERKLFQRYFDGHGLRASGAEVQRQIQNMDAELRSKRNTTYVRLIAAMGFTAEEHAALIGYQLSLGRLVSSIQKDIPEADIKTEFDAHPEWYDGSRVDVSQIFVETSSLASDAEKLTKAKERIDKCHADVTEGGKDFELVAKDYSDGPASSAGGHRGWFERKGPEVDDELISAAWALKVGEITKPIKGSQGWHILKVNDREPARFTFFGAKQRVVKELTRRRLTALLDDLKAKAKIEKFI